jgi:hypothetical protein
VVVSARCSWRRTKKLSAHQLRWNGTDYVVANLPVPEADAPPSQAVPPAPPRLQRIRRHPIASNVHFMLHAGKAMIAALAAIPVANLLAACGDDPTVSPQPRR